MPQTLQDVISRVRSEIDESAARMFTDTELTNWINDALRDVARRAENLITVDSTVQIPAFVPSSFAPGPPQYPLNLGTGEAVTGFGSSGPTDVLRLDRVEFVPSNQNNQIYRIEPSTQNEMDQIWGTYQQNSSSYPRWYVLNGYPGGSGRNLFTIQLYPVPSQSGTLNIYYYRLPTRISDPIANPASYLTTIDVVEGWDDLAVTYALYKSLQKQRDPEWQARKQEYEANLAQMIDTTRKFHDQQSYISYGTNMLPSWLVGGGEW